MDRTENIRLVVFDWAGTTVDYGSRAPSEVFSRVFAREGVHLTRAEIDRPMGMEKKAHIRELLKGSEGGTQWRAVKGRDWTEEDVDRLYESFEAQLSQVVAEYSMPIPGVVETVEELRGMGIKIGSSTGYNRDIMGHVIPQAREQGYEPDCVVTPDDTIAGRPSPFMVFKCMEELGVYPPRAVVKVGDTVMDILEGKNAGAWSVGVLTGSSLLGLTMEEYEAMPLEALRTLKKSAQDRYIEAGADMVVDNISELPKAIAIIEERMAQEGRDR